MPELKNTFTGGRMEKDLDERVVPNGLYREALNIEVSTSEDSDVGAAQNILGNIQVTEALQGPPWGEFITKYQGDNRHIAHIVDPETDMLYRFVATESPDSGVWVDRIVEYDTTKKLSDTWDVKEKAVMVDVWKVRTHCEWHHNVCGVTELKVRDNFAQIRPYMVLLYNDEMREDCRVMSVTWGVDGFGPYAEIMLSLDIAHASWFNHDWCNTGDPSSGGEITDIYFAMDRILNFHPDRKITGINVLDGMLFWTDNYSEPKKVNIERGKLGSHYELNPGPQTLLNYKYEDFDKHTKLVINVNELTGIGEIPQECVMLDEECPIPGCTNPNSTNYNSLATVDDGSCIPCIYGCTDNTAGPNPDVNGYGGYLATNYDPNATCKADITCVAAGNNECCCYDSGCMDPLYCNYDATACYDDGSCSGLYGCTDPIASNYAGLTDPPDCNDGSCEYKWKCIETGWVEENCGNMDNWGGVVIGGQYNGNPFSAQLGGEYGWMHQAVEYLRTNAPNGASTLLSTNCASGSCDGAWMTVEMPYGVGTTCPGQAPGNWCYTGDSLTLNGNYFAAQVNPDNTSVYKCIKPSTGDPATMGAGDNWLVSRSVSTLVIPSLLPEDPSNPPGWGGDPTLFAGGSTVPQIRMEKCELGRDAGVSFPNYNTSIFGTAQYGIGFTQPNDDWSWGPNDFGHPDMITICRYIGFDGNNPWGASLTNDITVPSFTGGVNNDGEYLAGVIMPEITVLMPVQDVFALIFAQWTITATTYTRTWIQPSWSTGVFDQNGGTQTTYTWKMGTGAAVGSEQWFGYCECDNWGACECVEDTYGFNSKLECEASAGNCCGIPILIHHQTNGGGVIPSPWLTPSIGGPYIPPPPPPPESSRLAAPPLPSYSTTSPPPQPENITEIDEY